MTDDSSQSGPHADLVVVGFGAAGAAAALTGASAGARVIIVEKQPRAQHTPSTKMSMGFTFAVNDVEAATRYLDECAGGMIPVAVSRAWAEKARSLVQWHDDMGLDLDFECIDSGEQPFVGSDAVEVLRQGRLVDGRRIGDVLSQGHYFDGLRMDPSEDGQERPELRMGYEYFEALAVAVEGHPNIQVIWDSPARRLITDPDGAVVGVIHGDPVRPSHVWATRGVVLAAGGYEFDEAAKLNYLKAYPIHFYGNPGNVGDGIRMAQEVGADLWHMNQMIGRGVGHFPLEEGRSVNVMLEINPLDVANSRDPSGYIIVDKHGNRFADESPQASLGHSFYYHLLSYDPDRRDYPRIPCYWLFDDARLKAGPLIPRRAGVHRVGIYSWSQDNRVEVERGWIKQGASIEEAAARAGILDTAAVAASVSDYNEACRNGLDRFARPVDTLVPLIGPNYYCVPMYPGGSNTSGGPRRNERAQVLDVHGQPIAGLYAAGEMGQAYGLLYPAGGANLSEANCFGRLAAESALGL